MSEAVQLPISSSTEENASELQEYCDRINRYVRLQVTSPWRYTSVHALLLGWKDDDLGTEKEINDLNSLFQNTYYYQTEKYLIPSQDPATNLADKLMDFKKSYDSSRNLLLVYYGGHGFLERHDNRPSRSIWSSRKTKGVKLVWSDLQWILESAHSDVVFILDCCYAATASRSAGSKEGLWASNSEVTTPGVYDNSFTQNLIAEMTTLCTSRFNVAMLHNNLMKRYRQPGYPTLRTEPWYINLGDTPTQSAELTALNVPQSASPVIRSPIDDPTNLIVAVLSLKNPRAVPNLSPIQDWLNDSLPSDVESVQALGVISQLEALSLGDANTGKGDSPDTKSTTATTRSETNGFSKSQEPATESDQTSISDLPDATLESSKPTVTGGP